MDQSAKLSFYFLLAVFPFLLFLTTLLGLVLRSDALLQESLNRYFASVAPESSLDLIKRTIGEVARNTDSTKISLALFFTWWSSANGMIAVIEGLNIAHEVQESRSWWKQQLVASGLTLMLLVSAMFAMMTMVRVHNWFEIAMQSLGSRPLIVWAGQAAEWTILLAFVLVGFHVLYVLGPNVKNRRWSKLMPGTALGLVLWLMTSIGFKLYLSYFDKYSLMYGSIGAVIVLLLWFYLSGVAILSGAEMNAVVQEISREAEKPHPPYQQ